MKYRRLNTEELAALEKPFVQFLVSNTVTAADWVKIKEQEPEKALHLIDIFSDMIMEDTLKKINFLKFGTAKELYLFKCEADYIALVGLKAAENTPIDFTKSIDYQIINAYTEGVSIFQTQKQYGKLREQEIFEMMERGCLVSDSVLFEALANVVTNKE